MEWLDNNLKKYYFIMYQQFYSKQDLLNNCKYKI